jgi:hypothetical protein
MPSATSQSKEQFVGVERFRAVAWNGDELLFRLPPWV